MNGSITLRWPRAYKLLTITKKASLETVRLFWVGQKPGKLLLSSRDFDDLAGHEAIRRHAVERFDLGDGSFVIAGDFPKGVARNYCVIDGGYIGNSSGALRDSARGGSLHGLKLFSGSGGCGC